MLTLHNLGKPAGRKNKKRLGKGQGSGHGHQAGRGHKGTKARAGPPSRARPAPTSTAGAVGAGHARDKNVHRDAGADSLPPWLNALIFRDASGVHFCALLLPH